jgi:hypothetical protein
MVLAYLCLVPFRASQSSSECSSSTTPLSLRVQMRLLYSEAIMIARYVQSMAALTGAWLPSKIELASLPIYLGCWCSQICRLQKLNMFSLHTTWPHPLCICTAVRATGVGHSAMLYSCVSLQPAGGAAVYCCTANECMCSHLGSGGSPGALASATCVGCCCI